MLKHLEYHYLILLISLSIVSISFAQHLNDKCLLENGQDSGTCLLFKDCPSAILAVRANQRPLTCGFNGIEPIVCCKLFEYGALSLKKCNETYYEPPPEPGTFFISAVGGYNSPAKTHVHMAVLGYGDQTEINWACGGSLISEKFVLTAAHCIRPLSVGTVKFVRLGDLNLKETNDDAEPQDFTVKRTIIHPLYKSPSTYHDIALIELDRAITVSDFVRPACLHVDRTIDKSEWVALGWGTTSAGGSSADHLQVVDLKEYTHQECKEIYATTNKRKLKNGIDDVTQVCAGNLNMDTCQGDSGGPLQIRNQYKKGFEIIGVTSFGKSCGIGAIPGVYTRVSNYIPWIESIIWPY